MSESTSEEGIRCQLPGYIWVYSTTSGSKERVSEQGGAGDLVYPRPPRVSLVINCNTSCRPVISSFLDSHTLGDFFDCVFLGSGY